MFAQMGAANRSVITATVQSPASVHLLIFAIGWAVKYPSMGFRSSAGRNDPGAISNGKSPRSG